ncbi:hypothetical protein, partial [Xanthomonas oryzae]
GRLAAVLLSSFTLTQRKALAAAAGRADTDLFAASAALRSLPGNDLSDARGFVGKCVQCGRMRCP